MQYRPKHWTTSNTSIINNTPSYYTSKPQATKWFCDKIWDYKEKGGLFNITQLQEAKQFYDSTGFAVITNVIDCKENEFAMNLLLNDLKEINKNKKHLPQYKWNNINNITNAEIPPFASSGLRMKFGITHGSFAHYSRLRPNIRTVFAHLYGCNENELCCSWDSIGLSIHGGYHRDTLWLHADQTMYDEKHKKIPGWNLKSIQSALYYTESNENTVSFVCTPYSHNTHWDKMAANINNRGKHFLNIDKIYRQKTKENSSTFSKTHNTKQSTQHNFSVSTECTLVNLKQMSCMNGKLCRIVAKLNQKQQRYPVYVYDTKDIVLIKPINLELTNGRMDWNKIRQELMNNAHRIHVPKNGLLLWDSKCFHQSCGTLHKPQQKHYGVSRITSFISMSSIKYRTISAFKNSLIFAINGQTSTHWSQFMFAHSNKHPMRDSNGTSMMDDLKPKLNDKITENEFRKMIPRQLLGKKVNIFGVNRSVPLTLKTVHHLECKDLECFKIIDLWNLIDPKLRVLQPWMGKR